MAGKPYKFTPEQIETALMLAVQNGGAVTKTVRELDFDVHADTLTRWIKDDFTDRYFEIATKYGEELEQRAIALARGNAIAAAEAELTMIERTAKIENEDMVPQALRALSDSRSRNIDKLLALTGRPVAPKGDETSGLKLLDQMVKRGYVKLNVALPEAVEGSAEEEPEEAEVQPDAHPPLTLM